MAHCGRVLAACAALCCSVDGRVYAGAGRGLSLYGGPHGLGAALAQRRRARHPLFALRGGGGADDDDDDDDAVDDDVFDEDAEDNAVSDADFEEETLKGKVLKAWHGTPPMTQVYVGASLALTIGSAVLHNNKYPSWLLLEWGPTLKQFQLWRPFTTFLFYGPFGLSYLLTIHFVWTYMSILEKLSHAEPWEFLMMMGFGAGSLLLGTSLGMSSRLLGHNLSCFLMYIWSRTYEGQEVNVLEFFAIKAELLPWFFVAQTYLFEQEFPIHDLLGIAIGHLYTVARQRKLFSAPRKLVDAFEARPELMARYEAMADEFG